MSDLIAYCTREMVQQELNFSATARLTARVDRAIRAGAEEIHRTLHRYFYPTLDTRTFDVPAGSTLWLNDDELAGLPTAITTAGQEMTTADYILRPSSPPYRWIDINTSGSRYWTAGATSQNAISITGPFGGWSSAYAADTLASSITVSATAVDLQGSESVGVGDLLLIDDERMVITDRTMIDTGVTLSADIAASKSASLLTVSDSDGIEVGEMLQVGSEKMFVETILGTDLVVTRAEAGTGLSTHSSGAAIYAPRRLTVVRAVAGTTAATHSSGAQVWRNSPPELVRVANLALAIAELGQSSAAYTSTSGSGDNKRVSPGDTAQAALDRAYAAYGVRSRIYSTGRG